MKYRLIPAALTVAALAAGTATAASVPSEAGHPQRAGDAKHRKPAVKANFIDINNASPAELKKLPGIGDAEALKIVAGRPYGSKAWLVTKQILPEGLYMRIEDRIIARQPFQDGDKNAELYKNK